MQNIYLLSLFYNTCLLFISLILYFLLNTTIIKPTVFTCQSQIFEFVCEEFTFYYSVNRFTL